MDKKLSTLGVFASLAGKAGSFARRSWFEQVWFIPVWLLLGVSRFLILTIHFRHMASWLGVNAGIEPWIPLVNLDGEAHSRSIARVIAMASRYTPWESNCFPQAVVARMLLGLYGVPYGLFFGVSRSSKEAEMEAHAWVTAGRVRVSGGEGFEEFTVVGSFISPCVASFTSDMTE
ncbi:MAG: lasso peptide biosynthesis B2 protein [Gallionellaceae bacterium]